MLPFKVIGERNRKRPSGMGHQGSAQTASRAGPRKNETTHGGNGRGEERIGAPYTGRGGTREDGRVSAAAISRFRVVASTDRNKKQLHLQFHLLTAVGLAVSQGHMRQMTDYTRVFGLLLWGVSRED